MNIRRNYKAYMNVRHKELGLCCGIFLNELVYQSTMNANVKMNYKLC
jgi:hypothetical protein